MHYNTIIIAVTELEDGDENGDVASVASSILLTLLAIFIGCSII